MGFGAIYTRGVAVVLHYTTTTETTMGKLMLIISSNEHDEASLSLWVVGHSQRAAEATRQKCGFVHFSCVFISASFIHILHIIRWF